LTTNSGTESNAKKPTATFNILVSERTKIMSEQEFLDAQNAELYEALMKELKERTTGRWHYDQIDYCWTGKDADLVWHGYQGLHVDFIDDRNVVATVHCGKTVCTDEEHPEADEEYQEAVCGCPFTGDWSGDDWFLTYEVQIEAPIRLSKVTGKLCAGATASTLYRRAQQALKDWDREMKYLDEVCTAIYKRYSNEAHIVLTPNQQERNNDEKRPIGIDRRWPNCRHGKSR
jgi:hypothetical protein